MEPIRMSPPVKQKSEESVVITMSEEEANSLSLQLADLLCWVRGFCSARKGTELDDDMPMGVEGARRINLKIKIAIEAKNAKEEFPG
jgi:hypothetical protein